LLFSFYIEQIDKLTFKPGIHPVVVKVTQLTIGFVCEWAMICIGATVLVIFQVLRFLK
jgi:hypothetical protein